MHRYASVAVAAGLLICAAPALAQNIVSPRTGGAPIVSATAKPIPAGLSAADQAAMAAASRESLFIMRAGFLASTKGQTPATKQLATDLIGYHTQALSDFRGAALAAGMKAPSIALTADQDKRLAALEAASGAAFDQLFRSEVTASQARTSGALLAHGKTKGNLIIVAQANRQGNQIAALNAKTKTR